MEFLANPDLKNVALGASPTGSTKVAVLEGANNTVKYRTVDDIVSAGGGTTSPRDFQITLLGALGSDNIVNPSVIGVTHSENDWGWPNINAANQPDSFKQGAKFIIPFKPSNYRISTHVVSAPTYYGGTPTSGNFGINFEYSTDNSTWSNIGTIQFFGVVAGDFVSINGTLTISGNAPVYIRTKSSSSLNNSVTLSEVSVRTFVANFWS